VIKAKLKKTDNSKPLGELLRQVADMQVFVGIPEEKAVRKWEKKWSSVNNAQLLYIHTNGSEKMKIPARPVIEPAIEAKGNKEMITEELRKALDSLLDKKPGQASIHLKRAGMIGQNVSRAWFTDARNGWAPNTPLTIARKGSDQPLIDTGQLRKAITYVVGKGYWQIQY